MIESRWSTIDGKVWTLGKDHYRASVELIAYQNGLYYASKLLELNADGVWDEVVSYAMYSARKDAEDHILSTMDALIATREVISNEN